MVMQNIVFVLTETKLNLIQSLFWLGALWRAIHEPKSYCFVMASTNCVCLTTFLLYFNCVYPS